jgi:2-keto-4-pentenoate hydratase/2-oxohepta-3-ene-1,7-dioic acid hydratase in catechol pathway
MRLLSYRHQGNRQLGIERDGRILPVSGVGGMVELIVRWDELKGKLGRLPPGPAPSEVAVLAPIEPPVRNPFCVGWNYKKHFEEGQGKRMGQDSEKLPEHPTFFTKATLAVAAPFGELPLNEDATSRLDWEAELTVVIGKRGRNIPEAQALDYVFGYTIANDLSARELQRGHGGQWFKGKSLDGTCPLGPVIVTKDEIPDPQVLDVRCRVNGETMQDANTRTQIFTVARVIAELSRGLTLVPGDLILTGTPEGVGFARNPPVFLKDGDLLETEVSQIGTMRHTMRAAAQAGARAAQ